MSKVKEARCFRIPNEELKQAFFREPVHLSYIRFRIPNEELKQKFVEENSECKLVLEYLMRN